MRGNPACDLVHAYLHRLEGDTGNARFWYRPAGHRIPEVDVRDEWAAIAAVVLEHT